jgi:small conductance mechanosensitive channel
VDVSITHEEDIERAVAALEEIGRLAAEDEEIGRLLLEAPTVLGVEGLEDGRTRLRLVVKTIANEQWGVQRHLRRRIQETFTKEGLKLALPRREIFTVERNSNADDAD